MSLLKYIFILLLISQTCYANQCLDWFKSAKISPQDKLCNSKCRGIPADLATYSCNLKCDEFCKFECKNDPFWEKLIKDGRPAQWEVPNEKSALWTKEQKTQALETLNQLPDYFKSITIDGIFRMEKSLQLINPGTTYENSIVLYNSAFNSLDFSLDNVLTHELGHLFYSQMTKNDRKNYENSLGWIKKDLTDYREGDFIKSAASDSP